MKTIWRITMREISIQTKVLSSPEPARGGGVGSPHRGRFFDGWRSDAIRRDRLLPVRGDVFRIRTPCGRAEARPYGKNLPVRVSPLSPKGLCMTQMWGIVGGLRPPQKSCRCGVAAKPPHHTDNTRISAGLRPAGSRLCNRHVF